MPDMKLPPPGAMEKMHLGRVLGAWLALNARHTEARVDGELVGHADLIDALETYLFGRFIEKLAEREKQHRFERSLEPTNLREAQAMASDFAKSGLWQIKDEFIEKLAEREKQHNVEAIKVAAGSSAIAQIIALSRPLVEAKLTSEDRHSTFAGCPSCRRAIHFCDLDIVEPRTKYPCKAASLRAALNAYDAAEGPFPVCIRCDLPILGEMMGDGRRFAHPLCWWRTRAERADEESTAVRAAIAELFEPYSQQPIPSGDPIACLKFLAGKIEAPGYVRGLERIVEEASEVIGCPTPYQIPEDKTEPPALVQTLRAWMATSTAMLRDNRQRVQKADKEVVTLTNTVAELRQQLHEAHYLHTAEENAG